MLCLQWEKWEEQGVSGRVGWEYVCIGWLSARFNNNTHADACFAMLFINPLCQL